eukprot:3451330-Amphidinium_carterae.1
MVPSSSQCLHHFGSGLSLPRLLMEARPNDLDKRSSRSQHPHKSSSRVSIGLPSQHASVHGSTETANFLQKTDME